MTREEAIERVRRAVERIDPSRVEQAVRFLCFVLDNDPDDPRGWSRDIINREIGIRQASTRMATGNGSPSVVRSWTQLRNAGAVR
jgi:hypothetical protein